MNEAIERGAQAAYEAGSPNAAHVPWAKVAPDQQDLYRIYVTAAFKTLREPTRNQMLAADFIVRQNSLALITNLNHALIDKATDPHG